MCVYREKIDYLVLTCTENERKVFVIVSAIVLNFRSWNSVCNCGFRI